MHTMADLDEIPFMFAGQIAWNELADKLDPEQSITGNNWRILAEKLGFTMENILNIDVRQAKHGRNTLKLFEDYIKKNGNSVGAVLEALREMDRKDAVEVLDKHIPDIREKYRINRNNMERNRIIPSQNSCYDPSTRCSSLGYHKAYSPRPPPAHCNSIQYQQPYSPTTGYNDLSRSGDTRVSYSSNQTKDYNVTSSTYSNGHGSPTYPIRNPSDVFPSIRVPHNLSKIVQVDASDHYTSDDMDVSDCDHHEEGQPLATAIQREENYRNLAKRPLQINTDHMEDEETESPPINPKRPDLRLNIQPFGDRSVISPSPSPASGSCLAQLNHFAKSNAFMPGVVYTEMMQEKNQQEYEQGRRAQNKDPTFKVPMTTGHKHIHQNGRILDFHVNSAQNDKRRNHHEMPRTFPLRNKEFVYTSMPTKERPSLLKSSISVPNDMKPAEYRKAFKHIKVFVTYAGDSKRHIQKVLNLCRCLEKNGFTCCMDMFDKRMQDMEDRQDWCAQRFAEADFILMCVSPQYKTEVDMYECEHQIEDKELHIQYIYSLMLAERERNGHKNSRVIPLLFDGFEEKHIPDWLHGTYVYLWPNQYRDLLWCLTKPHTRIIKPHPHCNQSTPTSPVDRRNISL